MTDTKRRKVKDLASQQFYKFDKWILAESKLKKLSPTAKLLYMVLRDREELSLKNAKNFTDKEGCLFQYFDQEKASELIGVSLSAIKKAFKDLKDYKLIESVRQGLGKPNRLYILEYEVSEDTLEELSYESKKDLPADTDKSNSNNDINNTCKDDIIKKPKKSTKNNWNKNNNDNKFRNFEETFDNYSEDELERIIERNQRDKLRS